LRSARQINEASGTDISGRNSSSHSGNQAFEIGLKAARTNRDLVTSVVIERTKTWTTSLRVSAEQFYEMMILDLRPRETVMIGISIVRSSLVTAGMQ
jgi:hypothetical protein